MKRITTILFFCAFFLEVSARDFNIKDFGAVPNGQIVNTKSIQNTIDSCASLGGGTVVIPSGVFITGTIQLRSNINLHLESGAELRGSDSMDDYAPYVSPIDGSSSHYGIIYAYQAHHVSITGQGAIHGNEEVFFDWTQAKTIEWGGSFHSRQKGEYRKVSHGIGDGPVVPAAVRPRQMVIFSECKNVLVRDVQILKAPFWSLHFADCDGVIASGLKIWTSLDTPNSDGLDITSCNNVLVSDCDIRTGDDAIAITGYAFHFELPGFHNLRHSSKNINIVNCNLQSRSSGIRIGFLDQNSIENIHISNVNITNSNRGIGIFVRDEGSVENITISQVVIDTRLHTGDWWGNGEPIHISAVAGNDQGRLGQIKNVTFRDITCKGENGILVYGSKESIIQGVTMENLRFTFRNSPLNHVAGGNIDLRGAMGERQIEQSDLSAIDVRFVDDFALHNVQVKWDNVDQPYFRHGIHIRDFNGLRLTDLQVTSSPSNSQLPAVMLERGVGVNTSMNKRAYFSKKVK